MICEKCDKNHDGSYGSGRFCSEKCSRSFSTFKQRVDINKKVSNKLKGIIPKCASTGKYGFKVGYDPHRRKFDENDRKKGREILKKYHREKSLNKPFETLSKKTRRWILIEERGYKCEMCGITEWMKIPIKLEEDHINGDKFDHRRENLRLLCPNCHSITPTWRGRNIGVIRKKVTDEELFECIQTTKTLHQALIKAGLTPKGGNYDRAHQLNLLDKI